MVDDDTGEDETGAKDNEDDDNEEEEEEEEVKLCSIILSGNGGLAMYYDVQLT